MKKIFFSLSFILLVFSCTSTVSPIVDGDVRKFKVLNLDMENDILIETKLMTTGERAIIYADARFPVDMIDEKNWEYLSKEFDKYYSDMTNVYGTHTDVDKNEKVILLFHLMPNGYGGYFTSADLLSQYNRNNAEVININIGYLATDEFDVFETMDTVLHEFQHLINFNTTVIKNKKIPSLWLNEALSESAYFVYQGGKPNTNRFDYFNENKTSESISKGNYFFSFDGIESYITASMFMYWLYQHGGGSSILKKIAQGTVNYDYNAVVNAVKTSTTFTSALGTSPTWGMILEAWFKANYINDTSSIEGYKNKYIFTPKQITGVFGVALKPGAAVYTSSSYSGSSSGNIVYKDIQKGGITTWKVVYNKSNDEEGNAIYTGVANLPNKKLEVFSLHGDSQLNNRRLWVDIVR